MLGIIAGAILTSIIMRLCQWAQIIPNQWDWFLFFTGGLVFGRLFCIFHKLTCEDSMHGFIRKFKEENIMYFNGGEEQILKATAGIILAPVLYTSSFIQVEASSLNTWVGVGSIVLLGMSFFSQQYYIVVIAIILILTGSTPWQPSPFYTGNETGDLLNAIGMIAKSEGRRVKDYSLPLIGKRQLDIDIMRFTLVRDKFYRAFDAYRSLRSENS